ncbi:MAG: M23 family metallopeptidase [Anaerolineae bacterium]
MRPFRESIRIWLIFFAVLLVIVLTVLVLTYLSGTFAILPAPRATLTAPLSVSPVSTLDDPPIMRYAQLDPAIIDAIDQAPSLYGNRQLDTLSGILSIGVYLPRTGDTQFEFTQPTPLPTPLPFPTSPPLPVPPLADLPTVAPALRQTGEGDSANLRIVPYSAGNCAPAGLPVDGILTQRFHRYHSGIDLGIPLNTPVIATHSGQVIYADWSDVGYGYLVIIQNADFITYYAHNTSFNVNSSDYVGKGSIIAWSGSTGNSTGPHVHYETRINDLPVDPLSFSSRGYQSC